MLSVQDHSDPRLPPAAVICIATAGPRAQGRRLNVARHWVLSRNPPVYRKETDNCRSRKRAEVTLEQLRFPLQNKSGISEISTEHNCSLAGVSIEWCEARKL